MAKTEDKAATGLATTLQRFTVAGAAVAMAFGEEPEQQLRDDLRRLKQVLEVGEVVSNAGPSARERRRGGEGRR